MKAAIYRLLLRLLPRDRRQHYGADMAMAFSELRRRKGGPIAGLALWIREVSGLLRFALREWASRIAVVVDRAFPTLGSHRPQLASEIRWAWRGVRGRGWRGAMVTALLTLTLAANTVVFAAADSFVFHRVQYPDADRLVSIGPDRGFGWSTYVLPQLIPVWRGFPDLFSHVFAYSSHGAGTYLKGEPGPRFVSDVGVEPGLLEMLGAHPVAGRLFSQDDVREKDVKVAILAEEIAVQEFGSAQNAIGRTLTMGKVARTVVGVLPAVFRFPSGDERVWIPLALALQPRDSGVQFIAKMAPSMTLASVDSAARTRAPAVYAQLAPPWNKLEVGEVIQARSILPAQVDPRLKRIFILLCAAAGCLLLVACANVVNLELAMALRRVRTYAVEIALGASSASMLRRALCEGAIVLAVAAGGAAFLAREILMLLSQYLPATMTTALANPLDLDSRAWSFMLIVTALTWLIISVPVAVVALRTNVLDSLKLDGRTLSSSRGGVRVRQLLTVGEVAMTVVLLVGALLASRSYSALLALPKGIDTNGLVAVAIRQAPGASETDSDLAEHMLAAIRARDDVRAATVGASLPPDGGGEVNAQLQVVGRPRPEGQLTLRAFGIDPDYIKTMGLALTSGRNVAPGDTGGMVIIDEGFARRLWPDGDAIGARFNMGGSTFDGANEFEVIGIAAHMRIKSDAVFGASPETFPVYYPRGKNSTLSFAVRMTAPSRIDDLNSMLRTLAPGARVRTELIFNRYANQYANEMLAASLMSAFGVFAFIVAIAGIYGVMAFLVAGRTREIGIRIALGADRGSINRMVLGSSAALVIAGSAIGLAFAFAAARWGANLLFGVTPGDPLTYAVVSIAVIVTAMLATWQPARQAGSIDPSRLLRD